MSSWRDLMADLNKAVTEAFPLPVVYRPQAGGAYNINAVDVGLRESETQTPTVYRVLFINTADLPVQPSDGDQVDVDAQAYRVFKIERDTEGGAHLLLRR